MDEPEPSTPDHPEVREFWLLARGQGRFNAVPSYFGPTPLESVPPPAWSYGEDPAEADAFVDGAIAADGAQTRAPASAYDELPEPGVLSILCDGSDRPRALLALTEVTRDGEDVVETFQVLYAVD